MFADRQIGLHLEPREGLTAIIEHARDERTASVQIANEEVQQALSRPDPRFGELARKIHVWNAEIARPLPVESDPVDSVLHAVALIVI